MREQEVVKEGTFSYGGEVECDLRIIRSPVQFGSGEHEDPPEVQFDVDRETYYVQFGSTSERGVFNSGMGPFASLAEAVAATESAPGIGKSVRWEQ
jgi:hypothetical protein